MVLNNNNLQVLVRDLIICRITKSISGDPRKVKPHFTEVPKIHVELLPGIISLWRAAVGGPTKSSR